MAKACGVEKLDRRPDLAVSRRTTCVQTCSDAHVDALPARPQPDPSAPALRRRRAGSGDGRAPPPAEGAPSRRDPTSLHRCRSGLPGSRCRIPLPGSVEELPGGPGHPPQVAPRALGAAAGALVPSARSSSARSLDQELDPSTRSEEPQVGHLRIRGELLKLGVDVSATTMCFAGTASARPPAGSDRPGRSSSGHRRTACSPSVRRPRRARAMRNSWWSRHRRGWPRSATGPPSPAPLSMPGRYRPGSPARRWAHSRLHPPG